MANTPRKEVGRRWRKSGALDQLHQVRELNREFLGLLQMRLRAGRSCLGLPAAAHAVVTAAAGPLLDAVAGGVSRALFQLGQGANRSGCTDAAWISTSRSTVSGCRSFLPRGTMPP